MPINQFPSSMMLATHCSENGCKLLATVRRNMKYHVTLVNAHAILTMDARKRFFNHSGCPILRFQKIRVFTVLPVRNHCCSLFYLLLQINLFDTLGLTLYRALLRQCSLSTHSTPWLGDLNFLVKQRFRRYKEMQSPSQIVDAMKSGYKVDTCLTLGLP